MQPSTSQTLGNVARSIAHHPAIDIEHTPYDFLNLHGHAVAVGEEHATDGECATECTAIRIRYSFYPRLTYHPGPVVVDKINHLPEQRYRQMALAARECRSDGYTSMHSAAGTVGDYPSKNIKVSYLNPMLMSFVESDNLYVTRRVRSTIFHPTPSTYGAVNTAIGIACSTRLSRITTSNSQAQRYNG